MDVRSQAGNIGVYIMTLQKGQHRKILSWGSQKFTRFAEKLSQESRVQETALLVPQLYLVVQGRKQLEHSSHIVKAGVEATC